MNKIYKVVWSKVKNCYVVVSEIAKNVISGSVKSAKVGASPVAKGIVLGALMTFVITGNVWAEENSSSYDSVYGVEIGNGSTYEKDSIKIDIGGALDRYVAIHAHDSGKIDVNTLDAKSTGGTFSAGVESGSEAVINLGNITLDISDNGEEGSEAYGVNVARKGNVHLWGNIDATISGSAWVTGLEAYNGTLIQFNNVDADVKLVVIASGEDGNVNDGEGVRAHGIYACGQSEDIIDESGNVEEKAYGASIINADSKNLNIISNAANGKAYGIIAEDVGIVGANGNVTVNATGYSAYGVEAVKGSSVELGSIGKNVSVEVAGNNENSLAIAIYADKSSKVDIVSNQLTISAVSENKNEKAKSFQVKDDAVVNVFANSANIIGMIRTHDASKVNINANIEFTKDVSFKVGGNSQVNLTGGEMFGILNIKEGNVNLTGAMFTANVLNDAIIGDGRLVVDGNGVLKTQWSEVFKETTNSDDVTVIDNNKVIYKAGYISLAENYNYSDLNSALAAIKAHKYDGVNFSATKLIMTGNLVEETLTVDKASSLNHQVELNNVTVVAGKNLLIGNSLDNVNESLDGVAVASAISNGFSANQLDLGKDSSGAVIAGCQEVILGGSQKNNDDSNDAHEVVTVDGNVQEVIIVVGAEISDNASENKGTLKIGNSAAKESDKFQLTGKAIVNNDSELKTKGKTTITDGVELKNGNVYAENGHLKADINVEGTSTIKGKITGELNAKEDTVIYLGDQECAGQMHSETANLNGGMLFLDPDYANNISEASIFTVKNVSILDGKYVAGQNSVIAFDVDGADIVETVFGKTNLTFGNYGEVDAVVYVAGNTKLESGLGSITADGELTSNSNYSATTGKVTFADKSLLMVEANKIINTAAISGVTKTDISDGAKLYINDATKGGEYKILVGSGIDTVWADNNIMTNNKLITFEGKLSDDKTAFDVQAKYNGVDNVYGNDVIIGVVIEKALANDGITADFFNAAANEKINVTKEAQIDAMNSAGSVNELAGVSHTTQVVSNVFADAVANHMSLNNAPTYQKGGHGIGMNEESNDAFVWAQYVHTKENVDGLQRAGKYDVQYNGIVVGTDLYKEGNTTVGVALTYVDGNINGSTLAARTENDAKYYGASIYGSVENKDAAVISDVSYLHGEHDISQRNSGKVITGKPESDAFSVGVRVERAVKAGIGKLVPYAGVRYMHLGTGNYANSIGLAYDTEDVELFLLPIGLKYSSEVRNTNGWTVRPVVELGYVWAFGDTDTNQTVSLNGASNGFGYDVTDSGSYVGRFMLEAERENISYALGYEYQKGDNVEADKWMVNVNWKF